MSENSYYTQNEVDGSSVRSYGSWKEWTILTRELKAKR